MGSEAAARVTALLAPAGVELECGRPASGYQDGRLKIEAGRPRSVDALPGIMGRALPEVPRNQDDFIVADEPPWWPPAKIAGRYVAPFLARWAEDAESRLSR
jgi:hypothetical protein